MRSLAAFAVFALLFGPAGGRQGSGVISSQQARALPNDSQAPQTTIATVSFCDMIGRPADFDAKEVRVTATYSQTFHERVFYDHSCLESQDPSNGTALAQFSGSTLESARASRTISQALKKYKAYELQVTMIAVFADPRASGNLPRSCCRFNLMVKQVLSLERAKV
jgi:hypothetical protein